MRGIRARSLGYSAGVCTLVALGWILTGQAAGPAKQRISLPTDWSHHHVVFSRPQTAEEYARVVDEPRFLQQMYRREMPGARLAVSRVEPTSLRNAVLPAKLKPTMHRDWAVNLGTGATIGQGNYPAKFGFDVTTASCAADYVVYSTGLTGSATQASIVGFTNIYSGCAGSPTINWAYDTGGGKILTSPVISFDGTQVAVAQTNGGIGQLVLLKWAASGSETVGSPMTLSNVVTGTAYQSCTAPCMLTITLRDGGGVSTDDTTSSVFYDYKNDVIWVGGALGWVHKITGAFKGAPAEATTGGFPVQVANSLWTSSAVYDSVSNNVFVGDALGVVYAINASTGAVIASAQLDHGTGVVDAPIIDQTGGFLYVFTSSDGSALCAAGPCAAVYQLSTTFLSGATGSKVTVGNSSATPTPMYIGGLDSTYFSSANRTGNLYVCGNNGNPATLYQVPITAGVFPVSGLGTVVSALAAAGTSGCSSVTDVSNPNTAIGPSERVFVSVQGNGRYTTCGGGGCLFNFVVAEWQPSTTYVQNQQVLNSNRHVVTAVTGGVSGATPPVWIPTSAAHQFNDGSVVWIDQGRLSTMNAVIGWQSGHAYASGTGRIIDSNGNVEVSTTPGTSGGTAPTWNTVPGGTTPGDGTVTWTNVGLAGTVALASTGGASGVIEDNVVSPTTQAGGSQVYFTTLSNQTCGTSGTGGCAVQASQPALQ